MPLQTTFGSKVTLVETTQRHPLGTIRVEGNNIYKYLKAGGTIANKCAFAASAAGTVTLHSAGRKPIGLNYTGSSLASGDYFWGLVGGETPATLNTNSSTAVGYPLHAVDADGTISGATASATLIGTSTIAVKSATVGVGVLTGCI